jgi:hypothetical protein
VKVEKAGVVGLGSVWGIRLKLRAEGDKLWADAIIKACGNIRVQWKSEMHCILETGEEFGG